MRIGLNAHLLSGTAGYRSAGIHGYMLNTLAALPDSIPSDWELTVMVGNQTDVELEGYTIRRSRWNTERASRRILWEQFVQPWQLGSFDLYHALAFVSPLLLTRASVVTVYDLSFIHYPQVLTTARRLYLRLFTALSCRRAHRVIGISQSTADDVVTSLGIQADKVDVAWGAYSPEIHRPLPQSEVEAFKQRKSLPERFWLFLGTLEPRKNLPTLLKAFAALPADERLPLILGGGRGWQYNDIFATIEQYQLQDHVMFPGYLPAEELALWYNSAEVFLYPSLFEGFGLPVLEAMGCGTPVIVSNVSSLPEVAGDAGLLVEPHNVEAWTNALQTAYHNHTWRSEASERGLERAKQFTWQRTAQQTVMSYRYALGLSLTHE